MSTRIADWNGLPAVYIENDLAEAVVTLHGCHVVSFAPRGSREVLWVSGKSYFADGKPIRGGIPVCWPWFGGAGQPAHGLARLSQWIQTGVTEKENGETVLNLAFVPKQADFAFLLANIRITVGKSLTVELKTTNNGEEDYKMSEALHTYFSVSKIEEISITGLDGVAYTDTLDKTEKVQQGDIVFTAETDRVYHTGNAAKIVDPEFCRTILVEKSGSNSTVVWNPWIEKSKKMADYGDEEYHEMVCVEAANAWSGAYILKAGESRTLMTKITEIKSI